MAITSKRKAVAEIDNYYIKWTILRMEDMKEVDGLTEIEIFVKGDKYKVITEHDIVYGNLKTGEEYTFSKDSKTYSKKTDVKELSGFATKLNSYLSIDGFLSEDNIFSNFIFSFNPFTKVYKKDNIYFNEFTLKDDFNKTKDVIYGAVDNNGYPRVNVRLGGDGTDYYTFYKVNVNDVEDKEFELPNIEEYELVE